MPPEQASGSSVVEAAGECLSILAGWVWGPPLLVLLFGTHLFLTFRLGIVQRRLGTAIRLSLARKREGTGEISHFGALTTALASTIGTGNIAGVATAIAAGGPGAVLWMWLTGVFGIATKYAEAVLSIKYRVVWADGTVAGGPMYVLERGLNLKWLGVLFAVFTAIAAFGIGNVVQANEVARLTHDNFGAPRWATGLALTVLVGVVILGGIRSIARVSEMLVPFMAVFYVGGCAAILFLHYDAIPGALSLILRDAFTGEAVAGGFLGTTVRYGVARGLFSNESGLGSAPIVAAAAQTKNPVRQALVSSTGTFWDTVVICAMTGLVLVSSGAWQTEAKGAVMTKEAFGTVHYLGPWVLNLGMITFVVSTILGWCYYGEKAAEYLLGRGVIFPYRVLWVVAVMVGSLVLPQAVWDFADIANGLMAAPNLVALVLLSGVVAAETRKYLWNNNLDAEGGG